MRTVGGRSQRPGPFTGLASCRSHISAAGTGHSPWRMSTCTKRGGLFPLLVCQALPDLRHLDQCGPGFRVLDGLRGLQAVLGEAPVARAGGFPV
jgi:hypothetical protein